MRIFPLGVFWGIIFLLIGVNIILKAVFNISIPFFRIIFGACFIYFGLSLLLGFPFLLKERSFSGSKYSFLFAANASCDFSGINYESLGEKLEINVLFSDCAIDLDKIDAAKMKNKTVEINTVFGHSRVYLSQNAAYEAEASAVFGNAVLPKGDSTAFGQISRSFGEGSESLKIKAGAVFGVTSLVYRQP